MTNEKHRVRIRWSSDRMDYIEPSEYEFSSLAELNAFLLGVDESNGWMDYEQMDPLPDGSWPLICEHCGCSMPCEFHAEGEADTEEGSTEEEKRYSVDPDNV